MKTLYIFILFIIVVCAQLFVPSQMIFQQEDVLKTGTAFKFKTQPVDPSDPFKGKYIFLNYEASTFSTADTTWQRNEDVYVTIKHDSLGFVQVTEVTKNEPKSEFYIKAKVDWYNEFEKELNIVYPFNKFYMDETKAYNAELAHMKAQQDSIPNNTYALVFIKNGKAVLDNVFINEIPIAKYVEK